MSWRQGLPPMLYPTHSLGYIVGVNGERITRVSCLGWAVDHPLYSTRRNRYKNPHSTEFAAMQTDRGHMVRCNVFWNVVGGGEQARWFGEKATLYMALGDLYPDSLHRRGGRSEPLRIPDYWKSEMLPPEMRHESGHGGSAVFISAEFINALLEDREPECNLDEALAMTVPGIVAHQSALRNGEQLKVPQI